MTARIVALPFAFCLLLVTTVAGAEPAGSAVLKRLSVPPLKNPDNRIHLASVNGIAVNNEGTRIIADNHPAVDIWDVEKGSVTRAQPAPVGSLGGGARIAQDASRAHVLNDAKKQIDSYNSSGEGIGSTGLISFGAFGMKRPGYDFSTRDYILGFHQGKDLGIYSFDPENGSIKHLVPIKDLWDAHNCNGLVRLPSGDFLGWYNGGGGSGTSRRGLHMISKDGKLAKIENIPSKDLKFVSDLAVSPDGKYLSFRGQDRLEVWDRTAVKLVLDWRQDYRSPRTGRFLGDGRFAVLSVKCNQKEIATSGLTGGYHNKSARLDVLEFPSLRLAGQLDLAEFDLMPPGFGFSPNAKRLVVSDAKQIVLYDVDRAFPGK